MLRVVGLGHVIVDLATIIRWYVRCRILSFMNELFEERIDLSLEGFSIVGRLHYSCGLCVCWFPCFNLF